MLVHIDTSVLIDAFTEERPLMSRLRTVTARGDVVGFSTVVLYEWRRGPRRETEKQAVDAFFEDELIVAFGKREAHRAADLYRRVTRARQRQADIAIAACAIEHGASLWTLT